ncbi:hypothetical protein CICLE_v10030024mg [Citrus x clementina]|uniref:FAS1 domain-containing protein n=1 Tax=Citrus clementina TaxID=85681 RepID=V4SA15_CITCL|nr:hypothetical protein CICLE_v10030024mg [Citrus x clementina]
MAMDFYINAVLTTHLLLILFTGISVALPEYSNPSTQINSNSVLLALLDSHYTELAELVEKALLLQTLEQAVATHNVTIFAPKNEAFERDLLDPEFKRFLLQPANIKSLQNLLLFHIIPRKIAFGSEEWSARHKTLAGDGVDELFPLNLAKVVHPDSITRPDGTIHGISQLMVPRNLDSIAAVKPEAAPEIDPRVITKKLNKPVFNVKPYSPPVLPISEAIAAGPGQAPASAPAPGGPRDHFDGHIQVKDFIKTLVHYGGYNEMADILVNLTSLASEIGKLVSEGYVLTILAPNDEAMVKLTTDQLSEPGAAEQIMYYHMVAEYQTEESMYNAVRRFGKVEFDTLRVPHKVVAVEADGSVEFGSGGGNGAAYLFDPDIYTDGRISVQGIDGVLFPVKEGTKNSKKTKAVAKVAANPARRGKLLEAACWMLGAFRQDSRFITCH